MDIVNDSQKYKKRKKTGDSATKLYCNVLKRAPFYPRTHLHNNKTSLIIRTNRFMVFLLIEQFKFLIDFITFYSVKGKCEPEEPADHRKHLVHGFSSSPFNHLVLLWFYICAPCTYTSLPRLARTHKKRYGQQQNTCSFSFI